MKRVYGIPARVASTRFPGKLLERIGGKTVLQQVWETVQTHSSDLELYVCTSDSEIKNHCATFGAKVFETDSGCRNGTERMAQLAAKTGADEIINVQADDPSLSSQVLMDLESHPLLDDEVVTPIFKMYQEHEDIENPNLVKVALANGRTAAYFSRSVIPYFAHEGKKSYWGHVGVYRYGSKALQAYRAAPPSQTEIAESLEQLRFLSIGIKINLVETEFNPSPIDSPEDLKRYTGGLN